MSDVPRKTEGEAPEVIGELSIVKVGQKVCGGYILTREDLELATEMFPELIYDKEKGTLTLPIVASIDAFMEEDK
jgi:hypothetical protein